MAQDKKILVSVGSVVASGLLTILVLAGFSEEQEETEVPLGRGVVVESVSEGSALEQAGVLPGDILRAWERLPNPPANPTSASGRIDSIFDWLWVDWDQRPRGRFRLVVTRGATTDTVEVPMGLWRVRARPRFSGAILENYLGGEAYLENGEVEKALEAWEITAKQAKHEGDSLSECWLGWKVGKAQWSEMKDSERALMTLTATLEEASAPLCQVLILEAVGEVNRRTQSFAASELAYSRSIGLLRKLRGDSLALARMLKHLAGLAWQQDQLDKAERFNKEVHELLEEIAPGSLDLAASLNNLGVMAWRSGKLDEAKQHHSAALKIQRELAPGSEFEARSLDSLGVVSRGLGELEEAESYLLAALEIYEGKDAGSPKVVDSLNNLSVVALYRGDPRLAIERSRKALRLQELSEAGAVDKPRTLINLGNSFLELGDLIQAEDCHRRALDIQERLGTDSLGIARSLGSLGNLALLRGSLERARDYYLRASEILGRLVPGSLLHSSALDNLGITELRLGHLEQARDFQLQALKIREELAPQSLELAASLDNLAEAAEALGNLDDTWDLHSRALTIRRERAPGSLSVALSLASLGDLSSERGELDQALALHREALEIRKLLAPNTTVEAQSLFAIGEIERRQGRIESAVDSYLQAIQALDRQMGRLGGSLLGRASFRETFSPQVHRAVGMLNDTGDSQGAFLIFEQWRAQSLRVQLAERDLLFSINMDPEMEAERRRLGARYDRVQRELSELGRNQDWPRIQTLRRQLRGLREQLDQVQTRLRESSPDLAALRDPAPLGLDGIREALDPGTVLLSYSVGEDRTLLFVVTVEAGLQVESVPIGEMELRRRINDFREILSRALPGDRTGAHQSLAPLGRDLYHLLVEPVEAIIDPEQRILVLPDGPLHLLPWRALIREPGQYLVEWKPVHIALSATVYAELKQDRHGKDQDPARWQLAAFGDPQYSDRIEEGDTPDIADFRVRSAVERGLFDWQRLPHSGEEVESIASLFPEREVQTFVGPAATEEAVKSLALGAGEAEARTPRILHFATHAHLDDRFPLDSAVVLSIPGDLEEGRDNGLLQVWEIFEQVRLDTDLVVLSACSSALGEELGGEGLIGLTRAFQYAGARSVVASLWNVRDQATAELMVRFYRHLRSGLPKDEALQAAQIELIREPVGGKDFSAPFFWAAFQLYGDWQ